MHKNELLFICRKQFGYSTDNYFHCLYLRDEFDITYISPDVGWTRIDIVGVKSKYIIFGKNRIFNNIRFYSYVILEILKFRYSLILLNRSSFFFLFRIFGIKSKMVLDIRSGPINKSLVNKYIYFILLRLDLLFYKNITIISEGLANRLSLRKGSYHILPLGAKILDSTNKKFDAMRLLYIGTLSNRDIHKTIEGYKIFYLENKNQIEIKYTIIGFGKKDTENLIKELISDSSLNNSVTFVGRLLYSDLPIYLKEHNIGVSFIPITSYFDAQPPTKTFEYILSGCAVIATETSENRKIINSENGILIHDDPISFYEGLKCLYNSLHLYKSPAIRNTCVNYKWENIVNENLKPYLYSLLLTEHSKIKRSIIR